MTQVVESSAHMKRDYTCLEAICSSLYAQKFCLLFCPAIEGEEVSFQKRKKRRESPSLRTHFLYFLGVYPMFLHSQPNCGAQSRKRRGLKDLIFHGQWRRTCEESLCVTSSDSKNRVTIAVQYGQKSERKWLVRCVELTFFEIMWLKFLKDKGVIFRNRGSKGSQILGGRQRNGIRCGSGDPNSASIKHRKTAQERNIQHIKS